MTSKLLVKFKKTISIPDSILSFDCSGFSVLIGKNDTLLNFLQQNKDNIQSYYLEQDCINPKFDYPLLSNYSARIEKGAVIREGVHIDDTAIVLMGAVLNVNCSIGKNTMIDMNAVIGSNAIIKDNCHISAGVVISGVLEPYCSKPVIIEDNVFIGANSVIKEGVHINKNVIIGANSFVNKDVEEGTLNYGIPAKKIRYCSDEDYKKVSINRSLRK